MLVKSWGYVTNRFQAILQNHLYNPRLLDVKNKAQASLCSTSK